MLKGKFSILLAVMTFIAGMQSVCAQQRSAEQIRAIVDQSPLRGKQLISKSKSFKESQSELKAEPYYVFEAGQGEGFVIVSGDERMAPMLAYSLKGDFDLTQMPDNVKAWLNVYQQEYEQLQSSGNQAKSKDLVVAADGDVEPFLTTQWGQMQPYNNLCPEYKTDTKAVTGCGATAMAQCMYYYKFPNAGTGSHSYTTETHGLSLSWDFSTPIKWSLLKDTYNSTGNTTDEVTAISELLFGCGVAVDMDYDEESGSFHHDVMEALHTYYGYDEDMAIIGMETMPTEEWHTTLMAELTAKRPLLMSASTTKNAGHMFIIHGFKTDGSDAPYYYVNWGWDGDYDGYFKMPDFNYDGDDDNTLSQDIRAIIGIKPDDGIANRPLTLQIKSLTPNTNKVEVHNGDRLSVQVSGLVTGSIGGFQGTISLALVDASSNVYTVVTTPEWEIEAGKTYSFNAECTLPGSITSGNYSLVCFARASGTTTDVPVAVGSSATIEIVNDENAYVASLAASAVTVEKTGDRSVTLSATNVMNAASIAFTGTMQILLTDYFNQNITTFGNTKTLSGLPQYSYFNRTDVFTGTLPSTVKDGAYRLWLGAQQSGYEQWGKVKQYTIEGGYLTNLDLDASTPVWVVDGKLTLEAPHSTVTFRIGDEIISQESLVVGEPIGIPEAPQKEGYSFSGWGDVPTTVPLTDIVITGCYAINQYRVRFVADGTVVSEKMLDYGTPITPPSAPAKTGYTFSSWGDVATTVPAKNVEYTAQYTVNQYTLRYVVDGDEYKTETVNYGAPVTPIAAPTKTGHTFSGWSSVPTTMPASDVTVNGTFTVNKYAVVFKVDGNTFKEYSLDYGTAITPPAAPAKTGYTFSSWGDVPATVPDRDTEYTAQYTVNQYHLSFVVDGKVVLEMDTDYGSVLLKPKSPAKEGYTFSQWENYVETMPAHDLVCTALFTINQYTLRYLVDGEEYKTETVNYGAPITPPATPTKTGQTFSGWSTVPATMPAHDVTVTGTFALNPHTLTFRVDGEIYRTSVLSYGADIVVPEIAEREGYTFSGWGDVAKTMPDNDLEYDASFTVNQYTLRYLIDGNVYKTYTLDYGTAITPEGNPEDDDYFYAWEEAPATMPAHDVDINAYITCIAGYLLHNSLSTLLNGKGGAAGVSAKGQYKIYTLNGKQINVDPTDNLSFLKGQTVIILTPDGKRYKVLVK